MKGSVAILLCCCAAVFPSRVQPSPAPHRSRVRSVRTIIGTAPSATPGAVTHGHDSENSAQVIPEVTAPFGMTNWTPQTRRGEAKCVAPYSYEDTLMSGFRGTHWLSGSCTQDYGSCTIMPLAGAFPRPAERRASRFSHSREVATPYYYRVMLDDSGIDCEITATRRCGLFRFSCSVPESCAIVIEPNSDYGEGRARILPGRNEIEVVNPVHRIYQGWGAPAGFCGYAVAHFSEAFSSWAVFGDSGVDEGGTAIGPGKRVGACVRFAHPGRCSVVVRIGTSFTGIGRARANLAAETGGVDFDAAKSRLRDEWESLLSRVLVSGGKEPDRVKLYTALYHAFLQPRVYNDCDGSYPSFGGGDSICNAGGSDYYCDFSLWDTYRAVHPLFNLLIPDINAAMIRSLLLKARQGGWLPVFPCWNSYTSAMIGNHAVAVTADAVVTGAVRLTGAEYAALKKSATQLPSRRSDYLDGRGVRALDSYMRLGFVPLEDSVKEAFHTGEQVSRTLEYAYDDFAMARIAESMGKSDDARIFGMRSKNYRNVYDSGLRCVCGRHADGTFTGEFVRTERMPYITEGTPWQYTWYVPHDIDGLIALMGGPELFVRDLDAFFAAGQYWHGNEPDQQVPFLYDYAGQPGRTQAVVRRICREEYADTPGGLGGNDDAGQISAWYVFASLGFYPVCPASGEYALCAPAFERATLRLPGGRRLVIRAEGVGRGREYARGVDLNGKPLGRWRIAHADLVKGGTLTFAMQQTPPEN